MSSSYGDDTDDENRGSSFSYKDGKASDQLSDDSANDDSMLDQDKGSGASDSERSSSVSPWDLELELQAIKGACVSCLDPDIWYWEI